MYLQFTQQLRDYKKYVDGALQETRESHIRKALDRLESEEQAYAAEERLWSWSPLYQALIRDPLGTRLLRPWKHTQEELEEIMLSLGGEVGTNKSSLESECPHVVRALKLYNRMTEGRSVPLAHPVKGMTRRKLLEIAEDGVESRRLSICAQDLVDIGFAYFPCTYGKTREPRSTSCSDMVALMGFQGWCQDLVLEKVELFLQKVARRALLDLYRIEEHKTEVATMWFNPPPEDSAALRLQCDEVCYSR